jgi:integrase
MNGKVHVARGSLGTRNQDAARRLIHKLETALSEGALSSLWMELQAVLPSSTYKRFSEYVGVKQPQSPTWEDLKRAFHILKEQRIKLGKLARSTSERYEATVREFSEFLAGQNITLLQDINKAVVEGFKVWRVERIQRKKFARGATGLVLDVAILHRVFSFAVENEMVLKNPVRMEGRPGENPEGGAAPFTATELKKLRENVADEQLMFALLRWTGLRGSDVVNLTWQEINFDQKEIERVTQKRKKKVILPLHTELLFALEAERDRRKPGPTDRILLNPTTNTVMTRPRLYQRMLALGKRAGVANAHPHRFRDTLAVDMLNRGASPYDVAKMLGDTIDTVEKHYTPFVRELRERVRSILENGVGLEEMAKLAPEFGRSPQKKPN